MATGATRLPSPVERRVSRPVRLACVDGTALSYRPGIALNVAGAGCVGWAQWLNHREHGIGPVEPVLAWPVHRSRQLWQRVTRREPPTIHGEVHAVLPTLTANMSGRAYWRHDPEGRACRIRSRGLWAGSMSCRRGRLRIARLRARLCSGSEATWTATRGALTSGSPT